MQQEKYRACEVETKPGVPHTEILRMARAKDVDLIIMGASTKKDDEDKSLSYRHMAGSTMQAVAKAARCPVLVIGRTSASFWGGISSIVFGTDFSKASESAFLFAQKLAKTISCPLRIFHACDISSIHSGKVQNQDEIEDRIRETRARMRKDYLSRMKGIEDYDMEVWEGIPYVEIVKYARETFSDLIVMAHHTRQTDPSKALLGSTMEQVVLRANCPVLSVNHPDKI